MITCTVDDYILPSGENLVIMVDTNLPYNVPGVVVGGIFHRPIVVKRYYLNGKLMATRVYEDISEILEF